MAEQILSHLMIEHELLLEIFREPSVTAYNRMEPRPRSQFFERSLRAEIRDPLWMLTRQWQMGELDAEDAGSAIDARLLTNQIQVDRISFDYSEGESFSDDIPMETLVERESITFKDGDYGRSFGLRLKMGQYFQKLHSPALRAKYFPQYQNEFSFDEDKEGDFKGQVDGLNIYISAKSNAVDGSEVYKSIQDGTFSTLIGIDAADVGAMDIITDQFVNWFIRQYNQPDHVDKSAWHPSTLDYQFSVAAPYANNTQEVLEASQYYSGRLDWFSFTENTTSEGLSLDGGELGEEREEVISFLPAPAEFKGMPNARFWEMEERQIDFGKINAKTTDHMLLLFAEFGLIYGNDWSVIPYKMPVNSICEVKGMVITDVFGDRTLIKAANEGDESIWQRWSMFNISNKNDIGLYNRQFYLPSTITQTLQSEPLEQVNFIRDEMANMAWGIENIIPGAIGMGINGHEASDQIGVQPEPIVDSIAAIRYLLGTTVPENWIPFLPVHKENSVQDIHFQRATMPKLGSPPVDVVNPRGVILNEVQTPYYINEQEISFAGTLVSRAFQRVRWYDGKTYIWLGRYRETGKGQGASQLRFDQIESLKQ